MAMATAVTSTVVPFGEAQPWETPANATLELSDPAHETQGSRFAAMEFFRPTGW